MTNSPQPGNQQRSNRPSTREQRTGRLSSGRQRLWKVLSGLSITLSSLTLVGMVGGVLWLNHFAREQLAPLVEEGLSKELDRPVKLGRVEHVSLTGLRFGPSSIPSTSTEPDRLSMPAIEVNYNLLRFLTTQTVYLQLKVINAEAYLQQRPDGTWFPEIATEEEEEPAPITVKVESVQVQNSKVDLAPNPEPGKRRPLIQLNNANGEVRFVDRGGSQNQETRFSFDAQFVKGGRAEIQATVSPGGYQTRAQVKGRDLSAVDISRLLPLPIDLQAGRLNADLVLQVEANDQPQLFGTVDLKGVAVALPGLPRPLTSSTGRLRFQNQQVKFESFKTTYARIPLQVKGDLDLEKGLNLAAQIQPTDLPVLLSAFNVKLPVPVRGELRGELQFRGKLQDPIIAGALQNTKSVSVNGVQFNRIATRFTLNQPILTIQSVNATPASGGEITGRGQVNLKAGTIAFNLQADNIPGDQVARDLNINPGIRIGAVSATVAVAGLLNQPQITARWQAPEALYPGSGEVAIAGNNILLRNTQFSVAGGTVRAEGTVTNGRFQIAVTGSQVRLSSFVKGQRGVLSGRVNLSGSLAQANPAGIRAAGQVQLSEGFAQLRGPLTAAFRWDGRNLYLDRATAPNFSADGVIGVRTTGTKAPTITALNLNIQATDYNLRDLPANLPANVQVAGRGTFNGKVTGTLENPRVAGRLSLNGLAVNNVVFDPILQGTVLYSGAAGTDLELNGSNDRIALRLDRNFQPLSFYLKRDQAIASGQTQGNLLRTTVKDFPIALISSFLPRTTGPIGGQVSGNFDINLAQRTVKGQATITDLAYSNIRAQQVSGTFSADLIRQTGQGDVVIQKPTFNAITADEFRGQVRFANGVATLTGGELRRGDSRYAFNGSLTLGADPQFKGEFKVSQGRLQDLFETLQWFDVNDILRGAAAPTYNRAADVIPVPVGLPNVSLLTQLRRFSEIEALLQQQVNQRDALLLPKLTEVTGTYSGTVGFSGSRRTGINATFDITGENWRWGRRYFAEQATLQGSYDANGLTLIPLRFQTGETVLAFNGQIGLERQSGQLEVENFPIEALQDFVALPINLTGKVNGNATIAGNLLNPQAVGELNLVEGTLSGTPVQSARTGFTFNEDRLRFGTTVIVQGPEPIQVAGSIPIDLPFTLVTPETDEISLDVNVKNEGLALLNLLNRQVTWVSGTGQLNLQVRGTLEEPLAIGTANVQNATLKVQALPEPLTNVNGTLRFDRDRVIVERVVAAFSDGQVEALGVLPISSRFRSSDPSEAIQVAINNLDLNLRGLYRGEADGQVRVTGALLNPQISGTIQLSRGQVFLPEETRQRVDVTQDFGDGSELVTPPEFNNLTLSLGDNIVITRQPILRFLATGDLLINGPLDDLRAQGKIRLRAGQVNIFTTTFNLAGGYEHTATFTPREGLDPTLDLRLITSVPEVTRQRVRTSTSIFASNETEDVPATNLGALQTVRIQARVNGPASRLFDNLELTSSPARNESEIIALLGGSFVNTLGRGDSTLALANLAGSALLTQLQSVIGNALGLSEFRLFPTVITSKDARSSSDASALGLAAEIGVDLTNELSLSVLRILNANQPTQFGLRYQLSEQLRVRGSTDFSGDNRAVVEYETRF